MKNKFLKSTIILIIGGLITKLLGMIIRIILTRLLKEGIGIYSLIMPTFSLLIAVAQFGMPIAISKLVAENKRNNKKLIFSIIPFSLLINFIILISLFFIVPYISENLLQETKTKLPLLCIGFVLPFISISSILRGYFFGKQQMFPHIISNITEDIIRLITLIIGIPIFMKYGIVYAVSFVVISNIISELTSILVLFIFIPKKFKLTKNDLVIDSTYLKDTLSISLPSTGSRLIGNIGYFLEPIILTSVLLKIGYGNDFIISEYAVINSYILPLLMLPSFFTAAISSALIPVISTYYSIKKIDLVLKRIKQAVFISLLIGIPVTVFFLFFPSFPLKIIYNTDKGINYLKFLAPIFLFSYIQSPIVSSIQAMGFAKNCMYGTILGVFIRTSLLFAFSYLKIGLWSLVFAMSFSIIIVTIYDLIKLKNIIKKG